MRLEPLSDAHLASFEELVTDPGVLRFTLIPDPPPPGYARQWLDRYLGTERIGFAAFTDAGAYAGIGLLPVVDREGAEAELGYMVPARLRGRGFATAILRAITRYAFDELGTLRAYLHIDVANPASQRVAARAGFTLEGVLRSAAFKQGRRTDLQVWSRLPSDPDPIGASTDQRI